MDRETFEGWLDPYGRAWKPGDLGAARISSWKRGTSDQWFEISSRRQRERGCRPLERQFPEVACQNAVGRCTEFREWWHRQEE